MAAASWSSRAHRYSRSLLRQRRTPNLFLDKVDRRTLNSHIELASAVPGEERCTLRARCHFWCFFPPCPLRLCLPALPLGWGFSRRFLVTVPRYAALLVRVWLSAWPCMFSSSSSRSSCRSTGTLLPQVPLLALLEVRKGPWLPSRNRGGCRWQRLLVVHVPSCWTARSKRTYVVHQTLSLRVPVQSCKVEGAPSPNRWGVAETPLPAKSQGEYRRMYLLMCRVSLKRSEDRARLVRSLNS